MITCLSFLRRCIVEYKVKFTVYSMTLVIDGLCKMGEFCKAKKFNENISKPNDLTYKKILNVYMKKEKPDFVIV